MSYIEKNKDFFRQTFAIAIPIAVQNMIMFGVSMMDIIMLGSLGDVAVASANLANQLQFLLTLFALGVSGGANILVAQYWGKQDRESINKVLAIMYRIAMTFSVLCSLVAFFIPQKFLSLYSNDPLVLQNGASYLKIMTLSYLFFGFTNVTLNMLRSVRTVKISLIVYTASFFVNTGLNYILIFGKFGAPAMGIRGAATATLISRIVEAIIVFIYIIYFEKKIQIKLKNFAKVDKEMVLSFMKVGTPVIINEVMWGFGATSLSMIVGKMGTEVVTAGSICSTMDQFVAVFMFGFASASSVMVGNAIGAQEYDKVHDMVKIFRIISLVIGLGAASIMFISRPVVLSIFNVSDLAKLYANQIMLVGCVVQLFRSLNMIGMIGILRGGGDSRFVLFTDLIFLWSVAVPLGALAGLVWCWPVPLVYAVLRLDEPLKFIIGNIRLNSKKWIRNVTI